MSKKIYFPMLQEVFEERIAEPVPDMEDDEDDASEAKAEPRPAAASVSAPAADEAAAEREAFFDQLLANAKD
ncbi:hypothetical protein [uncultured Selenomonas sp.]|jgi:iron-sulfur cluster repair protein YtfE (RIC family)|uniref:hypothetical protein n=1 Tax=uncultured Selenomonas sp. TaxID=159275 RepID=UPI0025F71C15|nr:hypothetical protein [uncultured Selenomonas sp.]